MASTPTQPGVSRLAAPAGTTNNISTTTSAAGHIKRATPDAARARAEPRTARDDPNCMMTPCETYTSPTKGLAITGIGKKPQPLKRPRSPARGWLPTTRECPALHRPGTSRCPDKKPLLCPRSTRLRRSRPRACGRPRKRIAAYKSAIDLRSASYRSGSPKFISIVRVRVSVH